MAIGDGGGEIRFRDLLVAASLKQVFRSEVVSPIIGFRDLLVAASLKRIRAKEKGKRGAGFRDLLVAASLKRFPWRHTKGL